LVGRARTPEAKLAKFPPCGGSFAFLGPSLLLIAVGVVSSSAPCYRSPAQPEWRQGANGGIVFTIVRRFKLARGSAAEIARRVNESFVPLLQKLPGFREYYLLEGGPDVLVSIRVFDSADEALASNEIAANWMRDNVLEFVKGMPEIMAGNVLVAESKRASGDGR